MKQPSLVSGLQPSGRLHIGNYLGTLKHLVDLQDSGKYQCYFFIADLHSLTENFDSKDKRGQILELAAEFLAAGLDPVKDSDESHGASSKKSVIFLQSQIPAHSELAWIFDTVTPLGELHRMTQFKDKSEHQKENVNAGLFMYPTLMAADILLYDPQFIPTGDDQSQHVEFTRTVARRFNARYGKTFFEPQNLLTKTPRIMALNDPHKKMSKSQPETCLFIDDSPAEIEAKMKRAVTDSGSEIRFDIAHKPAISNLLTIYSSLANEPIAKIERRFVGKNYSVFKADLAGIIADHFADFRKKKKALMAKPSTLVSTLKTGSVRASKVANAKMVEVRKKVGIAL